MLWIFLLIPGVPPGGVWQVCGLGYRWVWVCGGCPMHAYMCTYTCMNMHVVNMINMDASMGLAICNFYTCIHVHANVCMCVCVHVCVHVWGHPHAPRPLPPTCPLPRATRSPKHQNLISLKLIEIFRFCLKILYL